ncbi:uncharacterized protein LOC121739784 [Aricia agestis]|uniref:uncharacterized protein LOC121739784 n=1 Tax=Aricia agestis TaxID=91739 RepID=UPI001C201800|nr:uncharacterized protein LOC121739784 [Aricia agestis]
MLRLLLLVLLTDRSRTALVTNPPTLGDQLEKFYQKLERFTLSPTRDSLYDKLDRLNSLVPDQEPTEDEDEELLTAMQLMMPTMSDDELQRVMQELQRMKAERSDKLDDYPDDYDDSDPESDDYPNDNNGEYDAMDEEATSKPSLVTPSAFTRLDYPNTISAADLIAATRERPRILDDSQATAEERKAMRQAALKNIRTMLKSAKCLTPQPRWLSVRKLAPAADTIYMPPCVQLHRCEADSGCCYDEGEVCAPVDGENVALPFLLQKTDRRLVSVRMVFFNHTKCGCVPRDTLDTTETTKIERPVLDRAREGSEEKQNDWEGFSRQSTEEPRLKIDEEETPPPQMLRCTCPVLFRSHVSAGVCSCTCDWPDSGRRRECLHQSRGREHFSLRDRVCIKRGECHIPTCVNGSYEVDEGKCPHRFKRNSRRRSRYMQG